MPGAGMTMSRVQAMFAVGMPSCVALPSPGITVPPRWNGLPSIDCAVLTSPLLSALRMPELEIAVSAWCAMGTATNLVPRSGPAFSSDASFWSRPIFAPSPSIKVFMANVVRSSLMNSAAVMPRMSSSKLMVCTCSMPCALMSCTRSVMSHSSGVCRLGLMTERGGMVNTRTMGCRSCARA